MGGVSLKLLQFVPQTCGTIIIVIIMMIMMIMDWICIVLFLALKVLYIVPINITSVNE